MRASSSSFPAVDDLSLAKDDPNPEDYSNPTAHMLVLPTVWKYSYPPVITELKFDTCLCFQI